MALREVSDWPEPVLTMAIVTNIFEYGLIPRIQFDSRLMSMREQVTGTSGAFRIWCYPGLT